MRSASLSFCYKIISRFKNLQFPVKITQKLSYMPSLKQLK